MSQYGAVNALPLQYAAGINGVNALASLNAMNNMVNGANLNLASSLQNMGTSGGGPGQSTGFTPTFEATDRGIGGISSNDFNSWQNNFVNVISDQPPVNLQQTQQQTQQQATGPNGQQGAQQQGQGSFLNNLPNLGGPSPSLSQQKNVMQQPNNSLVNAASTMSPTSSVFATISSLPGQQQQNLFTLQTQYGNNGAVHNNGGGNNNGNTVQALQFQRADQLNMKMMGPSILALRGAHVAHGN